MGACNNRFYSKRSNPQEVWDTISRVVDIRSSYAVLMVCKAMY